MKRRLLLALALVLALGALPASASGPATKDYGDVTLSGGFQAGHFPEWWDLTAGDLVLSFTYDATGLADDFGGAAHAWAELGVRSPCHGDFNPTWMTGGSGVWLATDYDWTANTFDPDPPGAPTLDLDDKLILQRGGGMGEGDYNLPYAPPNPWANHAVWFDRDGVDPWQALMWGAIDGVTYNTGGTYDVVITLHATGPTSGVAYMTVNGEPQGFYDPNWHPGPADLYPAGMTFTGDMEHLRVFYGIYGYGATHTVVFEDITVQGTLGEPPTAPCFERPIDVKPGSCPNSINPHSRGRIPVAVLSTADFDAPNEVDRDSLTFGPTGDEDSLAFCSPSPEDVNGDGLYDLVCHFYTQAAGFTAGDAVAFLKGYLSGGEFFWGTDAVKIVP